jgi:hypothetical protein
MVRQLAERRGDGIVVELYWNDEAGEVFVEYSDERRDLQFTIFPELARALEAFYHPNAFVRDAEHVGLAVRFAA